MKTLATLPLSPRLNPSLGFYTIPVVADVLGKATGGKIVQAVNLVGDKPNAKKQLSKHLKTLGILGVDTSFLWLDSNHLHFSETIAEGFNRGWITEEQIRIWICPCGKTEIPENADNLLWTEFDATTYSLNGGIPLCNLCQKFSVLRQRKRLMLRLPANIPLFATEPSYAGSECSAIERQFNSRKLSISRERETGLSVNLSGLEYHLDPDLVWMLFPALASKHFHRPIDVLITGHKTLKHAIIAILVSWQLTGNSPGAVVSLPYINFRAKRNTKRIDTLLKKHRGLTIRCLLSYALGSKRKELETRSEQLYWIEHSLSISEEIWASTPFPADFIQSIRKLWQTFSQQSMNNLLAKLRGKQFGKLSVEERMILRGILSPRD